MTRISRRNLLAVGAAAASAAARPRLPMAAAGCRYPPLGAIRYNVYRKGLRVGEHVARFRRDGDDLKVTNDIELVVRFFGIPVYRYAHRNEEIWRNGRLHAVTSKTNKDGKKFDLTAERREGVLHVRGRKGELAIEGDILTASLWHPQTPKVERLLDIEDGVVKQIRGRARGTEQIPGPSGERRAKHYRIRGDMDRDLWYGDDCRLLRVAFDASKDGSRIVLEPRAFET